MLSSDLMAPDAILLDDIAPEELPDAILLDDIAPEELPDAIPLAIEPTAAICALGSIAVKSAQPMSSADI